MLKSCLSKSLCIQSDSGEVSPVMQTHCLEGVHYKQTIDPQTKSFLQTVMFYDLLKVTRILPDLKTLSSFFKALLKKQQNSTTSRIK